MSIQYEFEPEGFARPTDEEEKTVLITETKEETRVHRTSIAELKCEHAMCLEEIERIKARADKIVDELNGINEGMAEITVKDIPVKLVSNEVVIGLEK
jgi:hypothetical protein